jgi:hypothetical protein
MDVLCHHQYRKMFASSSAPESKSAATAATCSENVGLNPPQRVGDKSSTASKAEADKDLERERDDDDATLTESSVVRPIIILSS